MDNLAGHKGKGIREANRGAGSPLARAAATQAPRPPHFWQGDSGDPAPRLPASAPFRKIDRRDR
jgi:hypothetical protein